MKNSSIQWTDHTFNPWFGCRKVAPECENCYITDTAPLRTRGMLHGKERVRTGESNWKQPLAWNKAAEVRRIQELHSVPAGEPHRFQRPRVFCLSLGDWLDEEVNIGWFADLLEIIRTTPNLDWQLLTKRPQNWQPRLLSVEAALAHLALGEDDLFLWVDDWLKGGVPHNVWIGVSAGADQKAALEIPAKVHFLSCEPMLHAVDLSLWLADNPVNENSVPRARDLSSDRQGTEHRRSRPGVENCGKEGHQREADHSLDPMSSSARGEQGVQGLLAGSGDGKRQESGGAGASSSVASLQRPYPRRDGRESQVRDSERQSPEQIRAGDETGEYPTRDSGIEAASLPRSARPKESDVGHQSSAAAKWIILGGESGKNARPLHVDWIRSAVARCHRARVPVFVKQLGRNVVDRNDAGFEGDGGDWPMDTKLRELDRGYQGAPVRILLKDSHGGDMSEWPEDLRVREFPSVVREAVSA